MGAGQPVGTKGRSCLIGAGVRDKEGEGAMTLNLKMPDIRELKPRITVFGTGGAGGNAVNNMIQAGLNGVEFVVANTDAQALALSKAERVIQMGVAVTEGLGAGSQPEVGRAAAEEVIDEISDHLSGSHMVFITAGMGGGTGTGAAPVVARAARELGILTVGVVTKPFQFEGQRRMRIAEAGITELQKNVDTLIVIPNQNLFRIANERTTFADAFAMADQVLYSGVACITDLMVKEGLINLDFADVRSIMRGMGKAMMGTGEASGEKRALQAAEAAIANPLLDETSMKGARGVLISISGGKDLTLFEVDEAATRIREEVDPDANIILGATFDDTLEGVVRVSVVATGIDQEVGNGAIDVRAPQQVTRPTAFQRPAAPVPVETPRPVAQAFVAPQPAPQPVHVPQPVAERPVISEPVYAPMEESISDPAVTIQRVETVATAYAASVDPIQEMESPRMAPVERIVERQPYIPPVAEAPTEIRQSRMPRIDEFPPIVQRQLVQPQEAAQHDDDRRPLSLLKRLASGLGRHGEAGEDTAHTQQVHREPAFRQPVTEEVKRPMMRPQGTDSGYRPVAGNTDGLGRPQLQARQDDDQLEIPAFLRRQSN
jgi:cell division protein FtsZ